MSTTTDTNDSTENEQNDDEQYDWYVEGGVGADQMFLAKDGYKYVLGSGALRVTFDGLRSPDSDYNDEDAYELRDDRDVQGYFDPDAERVPDEVATAFAVLAGEL